MIDIREHGGIYGGSMDLKGKQAIKVFTQMEEPVPLNVGDIWIQTNKDVDNVIFRDIDPMNSSEGDAVVKIGNKPKIQVNARDGLDYIGIESDIIIIDYFDLKPIQTHSPDYIKLWESKFMSIWTTVGAVKIWDYNGNKWEYLQAYYWNGTEWFSISFNDYLIGIAHANGIKVVDSFGEDVSSYSLSSASPASIVSTPEGQFLFSTRATDDVYLLNEFDSKTGSRRVLASGYTINDITVDKEGNFYHARYNQTTSGGYAVLKYDKSGKFIWSTGYERFGSPGIAVDSDLNLFHIGDGPSRLIMVDKDKNLVWRSSAMKVTAGDKSIAIGSDRTIHTFSGGKLFKGDYTGELIWEVDIEGYTSSNEIVLDGSGCIYIKVGNNLLRKYDPEGNEIMTIDVLFPISSFSVDPSGYIYVLGTSTLKKYDWKGKEVFMKNFGGSKIIAHPLVGAFPLSW